MSSHVLVVNKAFKFNREVDYIISKILNRKKKSNSSFSLKDWLSNTQRKVDLLEKKLPQKWGKLSKQEKVNLVNLACDDSGNNNILELLLFSAITLLLLAVVLVTQNRKEFLNLMDSLDNLMNLILSLSEREHPEYQVNITEALQSVVSGEGLESALNGQQRRQRLQQLSDSVYS